MNGEPGRSSSVVPTDGDGQILGGKKKTASMTFMDSPSGEGGHAETTVDVVTDGHSSGAIAPLGVIDDFEVHKSKMDKPAIELKKKKGWANKGESLGIDDALQYMIKERAMMDLETQKLRRENEELRISLERKAGAVVTKEVRVPMANPNLSDTEIQAELSRLKAENERLQLREMIQDGDSHSHSNAPMLPTNSQQQAMMMMSSSLVQTGTSLKGPLNNNNKNTNVATAIDFITVAAKIWDGGYLWKIPYNGKGAPEKRIVALKRATIYPSPSAKAVRINRGGAISGPDQYIAYPPTLMWYNADKPGEIKNARELVLLEGSCLMEGHNTNAFYKLTSRDKRVPRAELCFSMMTTTRTLDMAAESVQDANQWKDALHALLIEVCPNKEWAVKNLRRHKPFWNNKLENPPSPMMTDATSTNRENTLNMSASNKANIPPPNPYPMGGSKVMKKEAIKKQLFAACDAGDLHMMESLFRAGVPANLIDEKGHNSDSPIMIACRRGDAEATRICLMYGAKNDPHPDFGETALHVASSCGHDEAAAVILDAAAQSDSVDIIMNLTNEEYRTPLHLAAANGWQKMVDLLLSHGAPIDCKDELDQTLLHMCAGAGHRDCLATLLDNGGDHLLEFPDLGGNTALHYAAQNGHGACIKLLLETAADVTVRNTQGQTAYKLAMDAGHQRIASLLFEYMKDYKSTVTSRISNNESSPNAKGEVALKIDVTQKASMFNQEDYMDGSERDDESNVGETALDMSRAHLPPSPKNYGGGGRDIDGVLRGPVPTSEPYNLPRPHTASSPMLNKRNGLTTTPPKNGTDMSPSAGPYQVLSSNENSGNMNRLRTSSDGRLQKTATSPGYNSMVSPIQQSWQSPQQHQQQVYSPYDKHGGMLSARDHNTHMSAHDMYSPMSARERPTPNIFEGMQVTAGYNNGNYNMQGQQYNQQYNQAAYAYNAGSPVQHPQQQQRYSPNNQNAWAQQHYHYSSQQQQQQQQHYGEMGYDASTQQFTAPSLSRSYSDPSSNSSMYPGVNPGLRVDVSGEKHHLGEESDNTHHQQSQDGYEEYQQPLEEFEFDGRYWSVYQTEEGDTYYLDTSSEHSQWDDPREHGIIHYDENGEVDTTTNDSSDVEYRHISTNKMSPKAASPPKSPSPKAGSVPFFKRTFFDDGDKAFGGESKMPGSIAKNLFSDKKNKTRGKRVDDDDVTVSSRGLEADYKSTGAVNKYRDDISSDSDSSKEGNAPAVTVVNNKNQQKRRSKHKKVVPTAYSDDDEDSDSNTDNGGTAIEIAVNMNEQSDEEKSQFGSGGESRLGGKFALNLDDEPERKSSKTKNKLAECKDGSSGAGAKDEKGEPAASGIAAKIEAIARRRASETEDRERMRRSSEAKSGPSADTKHTENNESANGGGGSQVEANRGRTKSAEEKEESNRISLEERKAEYTKMLEDGEPLRVVRRKMEQAEESKELIRTIIALADEIVPVNKNPSPAKAKANPSMAADAKEAVVSNTPVIPREDLADLKQDEVIGKYAKMAGMGIPAAAVSMKMQQEQVEVSQQNRILRALDMDLLPDPSAVQASGSESSASTASLSVIKEELSDLKQDSVIGKYAKMAGMGIPAAAVSMKMQQEQVEVGQQNRILRALNLELLPDPNAMQARAVNDQPLASVVVAKEDLADLKQDEVIGKYAKMAGMGIPAAAVSMKMQQEQVEVSQQNRILRALDMDLLPDPSAVQASGSESSAYPAKEELSDLKSDPVVGKYAKMAVIGVPHVSVQAKMTVDNIDVIQKNRVLVAMGLDPEPVSGGAPPGGIAAALRAGPGRGGAGPGRMSRRPSVRLQSLQWNSVSQDKLEGSVWATAIEGTEDEIRDADMDEIEKLFGAAEKKKPNTKVAFEDEKMQSKPVNDMTKLHFIDSRRAQNVNIGVSQFKNMVRDHAVLFRAISSFDNLKDQLTVDHLENLKKLLPLESEIKNYNTLANSLHPAEKFLTIACSYYPELPVRLDCFINCAHFNDNCLAALHRSRIVIDACNEVISSDKLARVLQKMLAVGNVMNQGTFRGNATGFTVDSLLRMINQKGK